MEIKCNICGTINDGSTNFCKGCFQKLDAEKKEPIIPEKEIEVQIEEEKEKVVPWVSDEDNENQEILIAEDIEEVPMEITWDSPDKDEVVNEEAKDELIEDNLIITNQDENIVEEIDKEQLDIDESANSDDWNIVDNELNNDPVVSEQIDNNLQIESNDDNWNIEEEQEQIIEKKPKFVFKFALIYLLGNLLLYGLLFLFKDYLINLFSEDIGLIVEFILYRMIALLLPLIAIKITFAKKIPNEKTLNKTTFTILAFVICPIMIIQLFILGFIKDTKVLMFIIAVILSVITFAISFSYMRNKIRKKLELKSEDKVFFIYGIVSIIIIILLLLFGMFIRTKNWDMPRINVIANMFRDKEEDKELIMNFIYETEKTILKNQTDNSDYVVPTVINDVNYATYDSITPDSMELNVNEQGGIVSGTIIYRDITYKYNNGIIEG